MQNTSRLREMTEQTLLRAERVADYAIITISDLIVNYNGTCNAATREHLSRALYTRGVVKDLRIMNSEGVVQCAGLESVPNVPTAQYFPDIGKPGSAPNINFHQMGGSDGGLLGISWELSDDLVFLAVVSVDSLMFDIFPAGLRQDSTASILLDGVSIAEYTPDNFTSEGPDWRVFTNTSDRFPLSARLSANPEELRAWNSESEPYIMALAGVVGLVLGYLLSIAVVGRPNIETAMREALRRKEFTAHVQPIFDLATRKIVAGEVLARWQKPDGSMVPPARFINLAEECGLILPMTWQIIDSALEGLSEFLNNNKEFKVSINITPYHLVADGFIEDICAKVEEYDVSRRQIVIEITERQEPEDFAIARKRISDLRELGFQFSLDDTGTGHNGLSNVQRLGVDTIKIDKHFTDLIGVDKVAATIVLMLVRLAQDLGMDTVAEGIETEEQLLALQECGVARGQGYLVSPAVPPKAFLALVESDSRAKRRPRAA